MKKTRLNPKALLSIPSRRRSNTSNLLYSLQIAAQSPNATLGTMTETLGDRAFGVMMIMLSIFTIVPFLSSITGLLLSMLGLQLAAGMTQAKLPRVILDWQLPSEKVVLAIELLRPKILMLENYIRPRWQFSEAPLFHRINGLTITVLGLIVALPIPFLNLAPALIIIAMGLGLLERDGLVQLVSVVLTIIGFGIFLYFYL